MYYFCNLVWPSLCVVSEEQINSQTLTQKINSIQYPNLNRPELAQLSNRFLAVPKEFVTVWIDPLDATHEYLGNQYFNFFNDAVQQKLNSFVQNNF